LAVGTNGGHPINGAGKDRLKRTLDSHKTLWTEARRARGVSDEASDRARSITTSPGFPPASMLLSLGGREPPSASLNAEDTEVEVEESAASFPIKPIVRSDRNQKPF
jgi:hypothetical protein